MLKKLIKYEWKGTAALLLPLHLALVILTLIGFIILNLGLLQSPDKSLLSGYLFGIYMLAIVALSVATYLVLLLRFYKNLFTGEGYLMFTLPVTSSQLLIAKLCVALLWCFINFIVLLGSILMLLLPLGVLGDFKFLYETLMTTADMVVFGGRIGSIILLIVGLIVSLFKAFTTIYISIAIGHLISKHKIIGSFLAYIVLTTIEQGISLFCIFILGFAPFQTSMSNISIYLNWGYILVLLCTAILGGIYFVGTQYIISKKLNLE